MWHVYEASGSWRGCSSSNCDCRIMHYTMLRRAKRLSQPWRADCFCATWTLPCTQNCLKNLGFRTVKNHSLGYCCLGTGCDGPHSYRPLDTCRLSRDSHTQLCRCSRRCHQPVPKQNPTATSAFQVVCPQPHLPGSVPNPKALHYVYRASCGYKVRSNLSWSLISSFQSDWSVGFQLRSTLQ